MSVSLLAVVLNGSGIDVHLQSLHGRVAPRMRDGPMLTTADAAASRGQSATDGVQDITNFGRNLRWSSRVVRPASEAAVLELLAATANQTIRVISSGHSWSPIAANSDVALDLGALDAVTLVKSNGRDLVRAGAGCTLQSLLDRLHAMSDRTLPTLGVITKQTVAGAISTGTHGSGLQSLSHFVAAVRIAVFGAAGKPEIRELTDGPALLAARCGLGCVGVLLSVDFETVPKYLVAETVRRYQSVEEILAAFAEYPLTSFGFWAHEGYLSVLERRIVDRPPTGILSWLKTRWFRLSGLVFVDIGFYTACAGQPDHRTCSHQTGASNRASRAGVGQEGCAHRRRRACADDAARLVPARGNGDLRARARSCACSPLCAGRGQILCRRQRRISRRVQGCHRDVRPGGDACG